MTTALRRPSPRNLLFLATHNRLVRPFYRPAKRLRKQARLARIAWHRSRPLKGRRFRFVAREVYGEPQRLCEYTLRHSGLRVEFRHGTKDGAVIEEVFHEDWYEPPAEVNEILPRPDAPKVVSLGGHIGLFALRVFSRWPEAEVVEFEAEPENASVLKRCTERNGLEDRWHVVEAFAAAGDGEVPFAVGHSSGSRHADDEIEGEVISVPAVDVFPHIADADIVKMDIEGGEWEILSDPRLAEVGPPAMVVEYHPHRCPTQAPRLTAVQLLRRAGYHVRELWEKENRVGMVWAWR